MSLSVKAVEKVILELVGPRMGVAPLALQKRGEGLQIDSLVAIEILIELEEQLGVRLPNNWLTRTALASPAALARRTVAVAVAVSEKRIGA